MTSSAHTDNMDSPTNVWFTNGSILSKGETGLHGQPTFADSMLVENGTITAIGKEDEINSKASQAQKVDLNGRTVLPGFVDGHMHLLLLGQGLRKVDLEPCKSLEDIKNLIKSYAAANPDVPRILCRNWDHTMTPDEVLATMLDDIDPRPIFIEDRHLHATWCNTAALIELDAQNLPNPAGGTISRDADGKPTGVLAEGANMGIIWPHLGSVASMEDRIECMSAAVDVYNESGFTGLVEMAMDEPAWEALVKLRKERPTLPMRIAAYWLIKPSDTIESRRKQVRRAAELNAQFNATTSPDLRIVGIKIMCDGVIDACTAYLSEPYAPSPGLPPPIWTQEDLEPIVQEADAAGLQIALHAIGDGAIKMAVDVLEKHATPGRRHRIEHLELAMPEDARRLGELGLTASVQPVHADPAALREWPRLLGEERCGRAFAYRDFADAGALMALGSDSPTASWDPFKNFYVATTRRSIKEVACEETVNEHFRLGVCEAVVGATAGAAASVFLEDRVGTLEVGKLADFVVVDMAWEASRLLEAKIRETWFEGRQVWSLDQ